MKTPASMSSKLFCTVATLALGLGLAASQTSFAHGNVSLNIGGMVAPGVYGAVSVGRPYYPPQVVYQQPQVVYQQPQIIYQQPQVVYQQPQVIYQAPVVINRPAYVVPAPVVVGPGYYGHPGRGYGHHHRHHRSWY